MMVNPFVVGDVDGTGKQRSNHPRDRGADDRPR